MTTMTFNEDIRIGVQIMGVVEGKKMNVQEVLSLLETFLKLAIQVSLIIISTRDGIAQFRQDLRQLKRACVLQEATHLFLFIRVVPALCLILVGAFIYGLK